MNQLDTAWNLIWAKISEWIGGFFYILPNLIVAAIVSVVVWGVATLASKLTRHTLLRAQRRDLSVMLGGFVFWLILLIGALIVLTIILPSMRPVDIFASLGIGSVAAGFAFKEILQNWLAGLFILIRRPFHRGDQIKVGSIEGTVQAVETRATLVKTYDGRLVIIPNSDVYTQAVTVNTAYDIRRVQVTVPIGLEVDLDHAITVLKDAVLTVPDVLTDPEPDVLPWEYRDLNVDVVVRWWTKSQRSYEVRTRALVVKNIKSACEAAGIALPSDTKIALVQPSDIKPPVKKPKAASKQKIKETIEEEQTARAQPCDDDPETETPKSGELSRGLSDVPR